MTETAHATEDGKSSVFGAYSRYYNLLYKDKDYAGEADYVSSLIIKHLPAAQSILDLGCGTGRHDLLLAGLGYAVTGVDRSEEMLAVAADQRVSHNAHLSSLSFTHGDVRSVRLGKTFDVVISLFHVMSYQISDTDLSAAFATARAHLKPGGLFIFDCWYGPAVLTDRPVLRVKRLQDESTAITRIAEPVLYPNDNLVDVNYQVFVTDRATGVTEELQEIHQMRYLFRPELARFLALNNLCLVESAGWMTGREPGFDTWGVCFVARG
jgi:SAM-dependent methyltransferase